MPECERHQARAPNKDAPPRGPGGAQVFQSPSLVVNEGETQRVRSIRTRAVPSNEGNFRQNFLNGIQFPAPPAALVVTFYGRVTHHRQRH